jgi:hypothetical protein
MTNGIRLSSTASIAWLGCVSILACSNNAGTSNLPQTGGTIDNGAATSGTSGGALVPIAGTSSAPITGAAGTAAVSHAGSAAILPTAGTSASLPTSGSGGSAGGAAGSGVAGAAVGGAGGAAGSAGAAAIGGSGGSAAPASETPGCDQTKLLSVPDDTAALGPWPIGAKTVKIPSGGVMMTVEIWYPGKPGSEAGMPEVTYDLRQYLGDNKGLVPDSANKLMPCKNCFREIPIDDAHGPYPAVIFVHGLASMRLANLTANTLWASRGFVVVAADHPNLMTTDAASCPGAPGGTTDLTRDIGVEIAALTSHMGDWAFLGSSVDMSRIGLSGHSTGALGVAQNADQPNVQVDMPLAELGNTSPSSSTLKSSLHVQGMSDSVTGYASSQGSYSGSTAPTKRLVGITGGDHMDVTDLCWQKNDQGQNSLEVGMQYNACPDLDTIVLLFHCGTVDGPTSTKIVNYTTTAALEETLHCQDRSAQFSGLTKMFPDIGDFMHQP